jgi:hypothetical protein
MVTIAERVKVLMTSARVRCLIAGALVGTVVAVLGLDASFIFGTGGKWLRPENDFVAYVVAWRYYIADGWRFPLFSIPAMGYPEGGSVLFNDALPVGAVASKIVYRLSGVPINPFGWWILLAHALQGAMAARLVRAAGVESVVACIVAATLVVCSASFVPRMGHTALSSHFLILWALALHFDMVRRAEPRMGELSVLLSVALLVNSYLFAMVVVLCGATLVTLWTTTGLTVRDVRVGLAGAAAVLGIGVVAGYGVLFGNPAMMKSEGFGFFSWNVATLLLPPDGLWETFAPVTRDATHGQYEGEAYIGRGALLLLVLATVWAPRRAMDQARRHWPLCLILAVFAIYAASNQVYVGGTLLLAYDLPKAILDLCNYFRASGRFIWPLAYALTILPLASLFRRWHAAPAILVAVLAAVLQVTEVSQVRMLENRLASSARAYDDMIDEPRFESWLAAHDRLWMYPSWPCGGLGPANRRWFGREANRELQVQLLAARANKPTNSVYTSRLLKDCPAEARWSDAPDLQSGVLYLLSLDAVVSSPSLGALARSTQCQALPWGVACSRSWPRKSDQASVK